MKLAITPKPPYYTVIFSSIRSVESKDYDSMSKKMIELVEKQPGFLGFECAKETIGITVSYWENLDSIKEWYNNIDHKIAQDKGRLEWYDSYTVRVARVERSYSFNQGRN